MLQIVNLMKRGIHLQLFVKRLLTLDLQFLFEILDDRIFLQIFNYDILILDQILISMKMLCGQI